MAHGRPRAQGGDRAGARRQRRPFRQDASHRARERASPTTFPPIRADADRLTQVIVNLVSNAVKFCAEQDGWIRLEPGRRPASCASTSRTTASASPSTTRRRSSSASSRPATRSPTSRRAPASDCRSAAQILQRFGGDIWVESEPGKGATFSFRIPLAASIAEAGAATVVARAIVPHSDVAGRYFRSRHFRHRLSRAASSVLC